MKKTRFNLTRSLSNSRSYMTAKKQTYLEKSLEESPTGGKLKYDRHSAS